MILYCSADALRCVVEAREKSACLHRRSRSRQTSFLASQVTGRGIMRGICAPRQRHISAQACPVSAFILFRPFVRGQRRIYVPRAASAPADEGAVKKEGASTDLSLVAQRSWKACHPSQIVKASLCTPHCVCLPRQWRMHPVHVQLIPMYYCVHKSVYCLMSAMKTSVHLTFV
jgi:hypothetical protein